MNILPISLILALISFNLQASTVAIIDSGTDFLHDSFQGKIWKNTTDNNDNNRDEDGNGYQDDSIGWNFAEDNNLVIDHSYLEMFKPIPAKITKFFNIQTKLFFKTASPEDIEWLKGIRNDKDFIKKLGIFGNFIHGTHVTGIAVRDNPEAKILSIKLLPTEVKLPFSVRDELAMIDQIGKSFKSFESLSEKEGFRLRMVKKGLAALAVAQMDKMEEIGDYVDFHKADVANGSFGVPFRQAQMFADLAYRKLLWKTPTEKEIYNLAKFYMDEVVSQGTRMVEASPATLFVFAAGNDGADNDIFPTSPTNIEANNVISVAATIGFDSLAPFSNYGVVKVDIAAPGVSIHSEMPGNQFFSISGTSQAAPYVANVASFIKDINPNLSAYEIKKVLMGTVMLRPWLIGKVKSSGIVDIVRAKLAAKLSLEMDLDQAIIESEKENITPLLLF